MTGARGGPGESEHGGAEHQRPEGELIGFRFERNRGTETLYVWGELDISSAPVVEHAAAGALDGQGAEFRLDVSGLTFMDSTGAQSLWRLHKRIERLGRELVLVHPTRQVRRVLELLGLDQVIRTEPGADG